MSPIGYIVILVQCSNCFHPEENHKPLEGFKGFHICTGSLECRCEHFEPQMLRQFAARIEEEKHRRRTIKQRCEYLLEMIPPTRNAGEKTFAKIYREVWYGFKIRKEGTKFTTEDWKRMPHDDTINREKRRLKQHNDEYKTYDKQVLMEQTAIFQALVEMSLEQ